MATAKDARPKDSGKSPSSGRDDVSGKKVGRARDRIKSGYYDQPEVRKVLAMLIAEHLENEK